MNTETSEKSVSGDMLHGNDLAIWVCTGSASVIGPYLFIQSLCADREPTRTDVKWGGPARPPGFPGESGTITLISGKASRELSGQDNLYLYCATVPVMPYLERGGRLQDWLFPSSMAGIIILFDRQQDHIGTFRLLKSLRFAWPAGNRTLDWARSQGLPLVVAATGYPREHFDADRFRERYSLPADVPVLPGPSPTDESQRSPDGERRNAADILGSFRFILGAKKVTFDPDYARRLVSRLVQAINAH